MLPSKYAKRILLLRERVSSWGKLGNASAAYLLGVVKISVLLGALLFLFPFTASAAISFVSANNQDTNTTDGFTVSSGTNRFLLFSGTCRTGSMSGVTYAGAAMTQIGSSGGHVNAGDTEYLFGKIAPASGSNNVVVSGTCASVFWLVAEYDGVNQTTGYEVATTNFGTGASTPSVTIVPTKTDWIVGGMWQNSGSPSAGTGTTLRNGGTASNNIILDSNSDQTTSYTIKTGQSNTSFDAVGIGLIDATQPSPSQPPFNATLCFPFIVCVGNW